MNSEEFLEHSTEEREREEVDHSSEIIIEPSENREEKRGEIEEEKSGVEEITEEVAERSPSTAHFRETKVTFGTLRG